MVTRTDRLSKGPPILPPQLVHVILNKDTPLNCEPTLLPNPHHVMLNHMYALSIKDQVMALSTTTRYRKKCVTTILYKPVDCVWTRNKMCRFLQMFWSMSFPKILLVVLYISHLVYTPYLRTHFLGTICPLFMWYCIYITIVYPIDLLTHFLGTICTFFLWYCISHSVQILRNDL